MISHSPIAGFALGMMLVVAPAARAQAPKGASSSTPPVMASLMRDVGGVHKKMVDLAKAIPANKYDWRPAPGVRTVREVMMHVASENYMLPAMAGAPAPAATRINAKDYKTAETFEKRALSRDSVIAELDRSFAHMSGVMGKATAASMTTNVSFFGQQMAGQDLWIATTTHLHEHLGQAIAYARMNAITPPWSK
ncbi:MAG TPA: DinB family protein [Gemmatimonas sp.]|nr:DinB family protein [Gemmatimonas sp.]